MAIKVLILLALSACMANADVRAPPPNRSSPQLNWWDDPSAKLVDWYDCSGKADGNYPHPTHCTRFMSCVAQTHAYERQCATCHVHPTNCPEGQTHYDHPADACLWADETDCSAEGNPPTTTTEEAHPTTTTTEGPGPVDPERCDPDDCQNSGYCHKYSWCRRDESDHKGKGKLGWIVHDECDAAHNLYWNPRWNSVHNGTCDFWENLDDDIKDQYNNDPECIDPHCEWRPDPINACSSKYIYFHPEQNEGQDQEMHCPTRPDREQLYWDQVKKSCHVCSAVAACDGHC
jgi:hypothetical protein